MTPSPDPTEVRDAIATAVARDRLALIAPLVRTFGGDVDLAEDALQDAVERAMARWPLDGIPDNPAGWLSVTARRRALDVLRRRGVERDKLAQVAAMEPPETYPVPASSALEDDRLQLLFACCHPALPLAGRVALTLKVVTGLSTREIARAFLVTEATMSQRLLRTKQKIEHAGIRMRVPPADQLDDRVEAVLTVVYLLFTEGYAPTEGDEALRESVAGEAIALGRLLVELLPDDEEARALVALMLLQHSRRDARLGADGALVPLDEQDRTLWDRAEIQAGLAMLAAGSRDRLAGAGAYRLQAAIAALHATSAGPEATDWVRIVEAYDALIEIADSPVVRLNRLIAVSFRDGPDGALEQLPAIEAELAGYPLLPAVRADLLRRAGRTTESARAYREAIPLARTEPERRFLARRLRELERD